MADVFVLASQVLLIFSRPLSNPVYRHIHTDRDFLSFGATRTVKG